MSCPQCRVRLPRSMQKLQAWSRRIGLIDPVSTLFICVQSVHHDGGIDIVVYCHSYSRTQLRQPPVVSAMPQFVETGSDDAAGGSDDAAGSVMSDYDTTGNEEWRKASKTSTPLQTPYNEQKGRETKSWRPALPWTDERKPLKSPFEIYETPVLVMILFHCMNL